MTDLLFFDTDCLSAFLWVHNESLLPRLYPGKVVIPKPVYIELSKPSVPQLRDRIKTLIELQLVSLHDIIVGSEEYATYYELTEAPRGGHKIIGKGEAAAISLAKKYDGIVASNNLADIADYISEYHLKHTTTSDILIDAYNRLIITEFEANAIWAKMLSKRRKLGAATFTEYLKLKQS